MTTRDGHAEDPAERDQLIAATLDVVAAVGFEDTRTNDIIATAGIGRRAFWRYFSDKTAALSAGYDWITHGLRGAVQAAYDGEPDPVRRVGACLAATAGFFAEDPARAEVFLVQGPCAGRQVIEVRTETIRRLAELLAASLAEVGTDAAARAGGEDRSEIVIECLAGGLYEVAYSRTFRGEVRTLPGLVPELTRIALTPYLGREAAEAATAGDATAVGRGGSTPTV